MKQLGFRAAATAIALVIVFAPSPSGRDASREADHGNGPLIGRALAPTIDAVDVREQETSRSARQSVRALWSVGVLALAIAGVRQRVFRLADPSCRRRSVSAVNTRGCRAPPALA